MSLPRRYRSIYLAGATFTLLSTDQDARETLERMHQHLLPGGSVLIPLGIPDLEEARRNIGRFKEARGEDGSLLRVGTVEMTVDRKTRTSRSRLRYERSRPDGTTESVERDWCGSWWEQAMFREMLIAAGFTRATAINPDGSRAKPDASFFVFLAQRES